MAKFNLGDELGKMRNPEPKYLLNVEQENKIREILRESGADSASQIKAFNKIKAVLEN